MLSDGAIVFDRPISLYQPQQFPAEGFGGLQILAPFLADHDPRDRGAVRYQVYNGATEEVKTVSEFIRNRNVDSTFDGTWMLVTEWRDVPMFGGDQEIV